MNRVVSRIPIVSVCLIMTGTLVSDVASARPLFPNPVLDLGTQNGFPNYPGGLAFGDFNQDGRPDLAVAVASASSVAVFLGKGDGTFAPRVTYPTVLGPDVVQVVDVNGDGRQDLAVLSGLCCPTPGISILFGAGDGTFGPETRLLQDSGPDVMTFGDFNGDGRLDLVVGFRCTDTGPGGTQCQQSDIEVLLGDGTGSFVPASRGTIPGSSGDLAAADFDGDGHLDLAVQNGREYPSTVQELLILPGNGDGTLGGSTQYGDPAGGFGKILAADFNGDGRPDVALTACCDGRDLSFFLNQGGGGFAETLLTVGHEAIGLAAGDADGDGHLDLAVSNVGTDDVSILRGDGQGAFAGAIPIPAGNGPSALGFADIDRDGKNDLAVGDILSSTVLLRLGNGDGTFGTPSRELPGYPTADLAIGDFDHDGHPDVAVTQNAGSFLPAPIPGGVLVLPGRGDGTFGPETALVNDPGPGPALAADLNGDGIDDLAVGDLPDVGVSVFLSRGDGTFDREPIQPAGAGPAQILAGDLNGDRIQDLIVVDQGLDYPFAPGGVSVLPGLGQGQFGPARTIDAVPASVAGALGDFNGDGRPDLAVVNRDTSYGNAPGQVSILIGTGDGGLTPAVTLTSGISSVKIVSADFNGDGHVDLAVANLGPFVCTDPCQGDVSLFFGAGDGTFAPETRVVTGGAPAFLAVADVNGDGKPDLATANSSEDLGVLFGRGDGTFESPLRFGTAGYPYAFGVADLNGDGHLDLAAMSAGSLTVLLQQAPAEPAPVIDIAIDYKNPAGRGSATVTWRTQYESGLEGFNVVLVDKKDRRTRLNAALIPCEECVTGLSASYAFLVPKHKSGRDIFIEEVLPDGSTRLWGPATRK